MSNFAVLWIEGRNYGVVIFEVLSFANALFSFHHSVDYGSVIRFETFV